MQVRSRLIVHEPCMLYAARLGVEFWDDALLHITWLYNRTQHSAIDMTPHEAYTRKLPTVDSIFTFGAKITAKQPGDRPISLNPHTYEGIFLGYKTTMDNIRYWDINTGNLKRARHDSKDEIRYGSTPSKSSPASDHLLSVFTESIPSERTGNSKASIQGRTSDRYRRRHYGDP